MVSLKTWALREKQESNTPFFEQFFSCCILSGSFEMNPGSILKHFSKGLRGWGVILMQGRVVGGFGSGIGLLHKSLEQH